MRAGGAEKKRLEGKTGSSVEWRGYGSVLASEKERLKLKLRQRLRSQKAGRRHQ
jgi:hypothetical protein